jgi:alkylresorcinol/alkylpyrone synthase
VSWIGASSVLQPEHRDRLRFEQKNGLLRNVLTPQVPALAAEAVDLALRQVLDRTGIPRSGINGWILHPGGRDVLDAVRRRLGLDADDLRWSAEVLRDYGNLSSASVYFILQRALAEASAGGSWWLSSFGAGFSCHGALLRVENSPRP